MKRYMSSAAVGICNYKSHNAVLYCNSCDHKSKHGGSRRDEVSEQLVKWNRTESILQQQRDHRGAAEKRALPRDVARRVHSFARQNERPFKGNATRHPALLMILTLKWQSRPSNSALFTNIHFSLGERVVSA